MVGGRQLTLTRHHHQSEFQRMVRRLRRCQDDDRAARSPYPSLPHPGDRKRQLPLQEQLGPESPKAKGEKPRLGQIMRHEA